MSRNLSTTSWSVALLARWKYLLSFRKSHWELEDYPIIVRQQSNAGVAWGNEVRFITPAYVARVVNWTGLDGFGGTREKAFADLHERFRHACQRRSAMPRPGTHVPIEFASRERIHARQELVDGFVRDVLDVECTWLSDESSLWHFALGGSLDEYYAKITRFYEVDVRDVPDANIAKILDRISAAQREEN